MRTAIGLSSLFAAWLAGCSCESPAQPDAGTDASTERDAGGPDAPVDAGVPDSSGDRCQVAPTDGWRGPVEASLWTSTPFASSAGLLAVRAAQPANGIVSVDLLVMGATVTSVLRDDTGVERVWVGDRDAFSTVQGPIPAVSVGDRVSFHVTEVAGGGGHLRVRTFDSWVIEATGQPVYVEEAYGRIVTTDDRDHLLHTWGEVTDVDVLCGGTAGCYSLRTGSETIPLQIQNALGVLPGDCIEVVAPAGLVGSVPKILVYAPEWFRVR